MRWFGFGFGGGILGEMEMVPHRMHWRHFSLKVFDILLSQQTFLSADRSHFHNELAERKAANAQSQCGSHKNRKTGVWQLNRR